MWFRSRNRLSTLIIVALSLFVIAFPYFGDPFDRTIMITFFMWAVIAVSWNLLLGYGGIPAFGNLAFFGLGGYTSAYLAIHGFSWWVAMLVGTMFSVGLGLVMAAPTSRLRGIYVALFTFAFEGLLGNVVLLGEMVPWTGGSLGLQGVPHFPIDPSWLDPFNYYSAFGILLASAISIHMLLRSRVGLALMSVRESELYAESLGVNVYRQKLLAFMVSAFFTGLIGSFYGFYTGAFTATGLSFMLLLQMLVMVLVGGLGTQFGPILGAFVVTFGSEYLRASLTGEIALFRLIVIGLLIPIVLIIYPSGLISFFKRFTKGQKPTQAA